MLTAIHLIAERKITEAIKEGRLNPQGWKGKPLPIENDLVPNDMRMAYKILKNSGFLPPEIETRKEIEKLEDLICQTEDEHQRIRQMKKLDVLLAKLAAQRGRPLHMQEEEGYFQRIVERIKVHEKKENTP